MQGDRERTRQYTGGEGEQDNMLGDIESNTLYRSNYIQGDTES